MKKRVLSLALALAIMVGVAPTAFAGKYTYTGCRAKRTVGIYRDAMGTYDLVMTGKAAWYTTDNLFLDPYEAWESYIQNKPNNWFGTWLRNNWAVADEQFEIYQTPNNLHPESPEWWARLDSYLELVAPKEHVIDNDLTSENFRDKSNPDYPYNTAGFSDMDNLWIEWYDITVDCSEASCYAPYQGMSFENWVDMRENMSTEEDALFGEWYNSRYGNGNGDTFEEYKEHNGFSENQPVQPSTAPVPTVTPAPTPTPSATPATAPEKTVEYWKAKTDPAVREEIELQPDGPNMSHIFDVCAKETHEEFGIGWLALWKWASGLTKDEFDTLVWGKTATPEPTPAPVETQPVQHFADVTPDAWYYEAVNNMAEAGILKGKGDGLFHPNDNITNAEVATIICRIGQNASKRYTEIGNPDSGYYDERIVNNPSHWAERALKGARAATDQMTQTFGVSVEHADEPTKRHAIFFAMYQLALEDQFPQYWHYEFPWGGTTYYQKVRNFTDEDLDKARQEIHDLDGDCYGAAQCWALGIIHGDGNGYIHPQANITRAELCQILYNMGAKTCYLDL